MLLVIGLGNPGEKYRYTRHNAGFLALSYVSQKLGTDINKAKFKSLSRRFLASIKTAESAPPGIANLASSIP